MLHRSFILVNQERQLFTQLNQYDPKKKRFFGEYSLLHNQHTQDAWFLSQFLVANENEPLQLLGSNNESYGTITNTYTRFLEEDIPKYMDEKTQRKTEQANALEMDKNIGQLQLSIVKKMVENQLETIQHQQGKSAADHQILLGKELSLQWVLRTIDDIVTMPDE